MDMEAPQMTDQPIEPPSPVAIARELCLIGAKLSSLPNSEQGTLEEVVLCLDQDPPDLEGARAELEAGMAHAFRFEWRERRAEAWIVAACATVLKEA